MSLEKKYDSDFYRIEVDTAKNLLKSVWLRPASTEEIIAGGTKLYEVLCDSKVERVIADARILSSISAESKEWMATRFYELLSQTDLKRLARVIPNAVYPRLALESVVTRAEALGLTKFEVKNFSSPAEALTWLIN